MQILPKFRTVCLPKPNCGVLSIISDKSITNNNSCQWKETMLLYSKEVLLRFINVDDHDYWIHKLH